MSQQRFWFLLAKKNSGEANKAEILELEDLMRLHPDWQYSAQHIQDIWGLKSKEDPLAAEEAFQFHLSKLKKAGINLGTSDGSEVSEFDPNNTQFNRSGIKRVLISTLGIGFAILCTFLFTNYLKRSPQQEASALSEVSTRMGSRSKLVLPDGSTVWLNAGSKLTYNRNFGNNNRKVNLTGEAYFDVVRNADLPFVIQTHSMTVKVLGTIFNVKSYPTERSSETSVIKGSVEIVPHQRPEEKYVVKPNEKLVVANTVDEKKQPEQAKKPMIALSSLTYTKIDSVLVETSWVNNKLVFDDESFAEVALKMERWYGIKIEFKDTKVQEMHLTGSFVNETIQQALEALQISTPFHYYLNQNTITIMK